MRHIWSRAKISCLKEEYIPHMLIHFDIDICSIKLNQGHFRLMINFSLNWLTASPYQKILIIRNCTISEIFFLTSKIFSQTPVGGWYRIFGGSSEWNVCWYKQIFRERAPTWGEKRCCHDENKKKEEAEDAQPE